MQKIR